MATSRGVDWRRKGEASLVHQSASIPLSYKLHR
jgi:hypothetical protein